MRKQLILWVVLIALFLVPGALASSVKLVEDGQSAFTILLYEVSNNVKTTFSPVKPTPFDNYANQGFEYYAAEELKNYLYLMSGSQLKIKEIKSKEEAEKLTPYIAIGKLANDVGAAPPKSKFGIDGHLIDVAQNKILLAGETPLASYYAAVHLLEILGCRWYMPGDLGEIVPKQKTLTMQVGVIEEVPDLWSRRLWYSGGPPYGYVTEELDRFTVWNLRNRQFGVEVYMSHAWERVVSKGKYFKEHPEWFAVIGGERRPIQLCTTNQEMIAQFIENYKEMIRKDPKRIWWSLSPDDGAAFCECVNCKALDPGIYDVTLTSLPQVTDRLVIFFNQVVEELVKEFPDKYFAFYAYVNHTAPPTKVELHPHLLPVITPITYSRYHEMNSPNSETQRVLAQYVEEWAKRADFILYYGYSYNLADIILPYTKEHQTRHDWRFMFENKLAGVCFESQKSWPNMLPWYYMVAKLNVDMDTDLDAVAKEFYQDFFGKAAPQMEQYINLLDQAYANFKWEMGNWWFAHLLFTPDFMEKAQSILDQALAAADGNPVIKKRIEMFTDALKIAPKVIEMRESTLKCDFSAASKKAEEIIAFGNAMYEREPESISRYPLQNYVTSFWKRPLDFSASKLEGSQIVHIFPDEWFAFPDLSNIGEVGKLYLPEFPLERWVTLKTYTKTLSEQGLSRFRGHIWYRQSFKLDKLYQGQEIRLLLSGIDDTVKVYVNGTYIDRGVGGNFGAVDFDISQAVKFGEENTIVLDVSNLNITELETGGIMRPVLLYIPNFTLQVLM